VKRRIRITAEIDGKRYRTSYENVILMAAPPTTDKQEELHPC